MLDGAGSVTLFRRSVRDRGRDDLFYDAEPRLIEFTRRCRSPGPPPFAFSAFFLHSFFFFFFFEKKKERKRRKKKKKEKKGLGTAEILLERGRFKLQRFARHAVIGARADQLYCRPSAVNAKFPGFFLSLSSPHHHPSYLFIVVPPRELFILSFSILLLLFFVCCFFFVPNASEVFYRLRTFNAFDGREIMKKIYINMFYQ